jgi:hypothetical protein
VRVGAVAGVEHRQVGFGLVGQQRGEAFAVFSELEKDQESSVGEGLSTASGVDDRLAD